MNTNVIARRARPDDVPAIIELWKLFMVELGVAEPDAGPPTALPNWTERLHSQVSTGYVYVAECGSDIVGFIGFIDSAGPDWIPDGIAYFVDIYVLPEFRRMSAARKLMSALMRAARDAGYKEVWTNTDVENRRAQILLARMGFTDLAGFSIPGMKNQVYLRKELDAE